MWMTSYLVLLGGRNGTLTNIEMPRQDFFSWRRKSGGKGYQLPTSILPLSLEIKQQSILQYEKEKALDIFADRIGF